MHTLCKTANPHNPPVPAAFSERQNTDYTVFGLWLERASTASIVTRALHHSTDRVPQHSSAMQVACNCQQHTADKQQACWRSLLRATAAAEKDTTQACTCKGAWVPLKWGSMVVDLLLCRQSLWLHAWLGDCAITYSCSETAAICCCVHAIGLYSAFCRRNGSSVQIGAVEQLTTPRAFL